MFLNAGRVRRIGPNRFATTFSRKWALAGVRSLRVDLAGIGDSDGRREDDEIPVPYDAAWYHDPAFIGDLDDVLAHLAEHRAAKRFVLIGLCSGATLAYLVGVADQRVVGVEMLNPPDLSWDDGAEARRAWRQAVELAREPRRWAGARTHRPSVREALRGATLSIQGRVRRGRDSTSILAGLATLTGRGVALGTVFSAGDQGIAYLEEQLGGDYLSVLEQHGMQVHIVDGVDHTFRPIWAHTVLRNSLEEPLRQLGLLRAETADVGS